MTYANDFFFSTYVFVVPNNLLVKSASANLLGKATIKTSN